MDAEIAELDRVFQQSRLDLVVLRRLVSELLRVGRYDIAGVRVLESIVALGQEHAKAPSFGLECSELKELMSLYTDSRRNLSELASAHGLVLRETLSSGYGDVQRVYLAGAEDADSFWDQVLGADVEAATEITCYECPAVFYNGVSSRVTGWAGALPESGKKKAGSSGAIALFCSRCGHSAPSGGYGYEKKEGPLGALYLWAGSGSLRVTSGNAVWPGGATTAMYGRRFKYHLDGRVSVRWRPS
jgi:hypothetical protein